MFAEIVGKRVLVTGASSGIGREIARIFGDYGAKIGIHYRSNRESAMELRAHIEKCSGKAEVFEADLLKRSDRKSLVTKFVDEFGGIDVLVNNAGACYEYRHFSEISEIAWDTMFDLHTKAPFILARDAFTHMKERGWGRIINISTASIDHAGPDNMHYWSSKAALDAITKGLAREGARHNILVNSIRCGIVDTPMRTRIIGYDEEKFAKRVSLIPLKRAGSALDIAQMVLFLASKAGSFITGEIIRVAGGE
ncbi:MAG: SDR family NAD(P)-dependent oxidoreductase [Patescibacteria group bacterium]